jgi:hypothetical protein
MILLFPWASTPPLPKAWNVMDADTTKVITCCSYVSPANIVKDGTTTSGDVMFGDEDASRTSRAMLTKRAGLQPISVNWNYNSNHK